jgi:hypothetical protein
MKVRFTYFLYFLLFGLGLSGVCAGESQASELNVQKIVMDYDQQALYVLLPTGEQEATMEVNKEIQVSYPVLATDSHGKPYLKFSDWDIYTEDEMVEDPSYDTDGTYKGSGVLCWIISFAHLKPTQEQYIAVRGDVSSDITLLHISAAGTVKPKYNALTGTLDMGSDNNAQSFEYRTVGGQWQSYDADSTDLTQYANQGATLYFRQAPTYSGGVYFYDFGPSYTYIGNPETFLGYTCYELGNFAGLEKKVKIPTLSAGPTVKIDYNKRTFSFKKGISYRFNSEASWTTNAQISSVSLSSAWDGSKGALYLQTPATETKSASKVIRYEYPALREVLTADDTGGVVASKTVSSQGDTEVSVSVNVSSSGKVQGIVLTNASTSDYQYVLSPTQISDVAGMSYSTAYKPKSLAAAKTKGATKKRISTSSCQGMYLYVRYASVKETKKTSAEWASDYVYLGRVDTSAN